MPLWTAAGTVFRLDDVADVSLAPAPNAVQHEGGSRRLDVTCDAIGRDLGAVAREIQAAIGAVQFPPGHHAVLVGEWQARGAARVRLVGLGAIALFGIGVILLLFGSTCEHWVNPDGDLLIRLADEVPSTASERAREK